METEAASLKRKSEGEAELEEAPQKQQKRDNGWASVDDEAVACLHDVSYPEGYVVPPPSSSSSAAAEASEPAKKFPFPLDPFQSEAINCLEKAESVMVSAHTSAGKTVVASYAIAMSLRNKQRVIYTSPIKALSNQKYREFKEEFSDVGLMTGDVTIDPNASCLVMTTEIWRSMQYKGSEITREVAWIIFDEVHYMRDRERGVVWEESIVMAPKNARFVFLSATVPNAKEFADWLAKIHRQPCHIVYTDYRPTPLQHYIFPSGGNGLYLVVDEKGKFREDSFQKALSALAPAADSAKKKENGKWQKGLIMGRAAEESDIFKMVKMIIQRQYDPVILFSFSKRECESLAMQMAKMDLNGDNEKENVETIFWSAMDMLSDDDKKLPQVSHMLPLLKRGIGVHHSGLLPILKEVIEILFQEGLIKCLFATETFSIGLNMPAKTVVFTNVRKFDGDKFRWLSSGEYIQMSGRAGRRGIDKRGICILMVDEKLEPSTAKMMLKGSADCLNSAFHLSYNMLLNQLRSEDGNPENLLRNSFYQFQADHAIPSLEKQAKDLEKERDSIIIEEEDSVKNYYNLLQQYKSLKQELHDIVLSPKYCLPFLKPGRLVSIQCAKSDESSPSFSIEDPVTWGVILNFQRVKTASEDDASRKPEDSNYTVDVLTRCRVSTDEVAKKTIKIIPLKEAGEPAVVSISISQINSMSGLCMVIPKDLLPLPARENTLKRVLETLSRFDKGKIPLLDPEEDMKIESSSYKKVSRRIEALENLFDRHEVARTPLIEQKLKVFHMKQDLAAKIKSIKKTMRSSTALAFKDELKARKRVLRRLGYVTNDGVVELKGKVACEISSAEELTLTELMFNGAFKDINVEEMVSLLSCFVWQEKLKEATKPREELDLLFSQLQDTARRVAEVQLECKVEIDVDSFVSSFRPDIMEAVYAWAKGSKFYEIMSATPVFEGSLIRAIRRLEEVLQQLIQAAKSIGETELESKFEEAVLKIKNLNRLQELLRERHRQKSELKRKQDEELALLYADPFDVEAQKKIEAAIRQKGIDENWAAALEHNPEAFARVVMLYVDMEVNGVPLKAFVDSGAQSTIISKSCAERCGLLRLLDQRYKGIAHGVGQSEILGRIHVAPIKIGSIFYPCSFMVLDAPNMEFLFGLDMLRKHQCIIDLNENVLRVGGGEVSVPFLQEKDIPSRFLDEERFSKEASSSGAPVTAGTADTNKTVPSGGQSSASARSNQTQGSEFEAKVAKLVELGFGRDAVIQALKFFDGNEEQAAGYLFGG